VCSLVLIGVVLWSVGVLVAVLIVLWPSMWMRVVAVWGWLAVPGLVSRLWFALVSRELGCGVTSDF
jgi:hypothetical protein